jgi:hypothetical protein
LRGRRTSHAVSEPGVLLTPRDAVEIGLLSRGIDIN